MSDIINHSNLESPDDALKPANNKSLQRALLILDAFTEATPEWGVSDLSRHLRMSKSSISTMLSTLAGLNFVYQSPVTRRYRLGLRCLQLGYVASSRLLLRDVAFPTLETLLQDNRIVYMGIHYQDTLLYIETLLPIRRQVNYSSIGRQAPLYCTAIGKAILANMPDVYIEKYIETVELRPMTHNTITNQAQLRDELHSIRQQGFALDQQEAELGIQCVSAPVYGSNRQVVAAISISGSPTVINFDQVMTLSDEVMKASRDISQKITSMGY